jgi:hypothetical protein
MPLTNDQRHVSAVKSTACLLRTNHSTAVGFNVELSGIFRGATKQLSGIYVERTRN